MENRENKKFCFYHPYHPTTWQAMIDCGLVKDGDGKSLV
jgi:hypothetical protein